LLFAAIARKIAQVYSAGFSTLAQAAPADRRDGARPLDDWLYNFGPNQVICRQPEDDGGLSQGGGRLLAHREEGRDHRRLETAIRTGFRNLSRNKKLIAQFNPQK